MATVSDVIRLAMQRLRLTAGGEAISALEATDGLIAFQSMFDGWATNGLFGRLNDVIPAANYTANEQDRVINDGGYVITLPLTIQPNYAYAPTYPGNQYAPLTSAYPRPPRDLAQIEVLTANVSVRSIYDAHSRAWVPIQAMTLTQVAPLSNRGAQGLASCLALQIADDFDAQPSPGIQRVATLFMFGLSARYGSSRRTGIVDYF
jgi:hypothetical protein